MSMAVELKVHLGGASAAEKDLSKVEQTALKSSEKIKTASEKAAETAAAAAEKNAARSRSAFERMSQARERLGIRSEQTIQREIALTEAAYKRLANSGTASAQEVARAQQAATQKVRELNNEMGKLTTSQKMMAGLKAGAALTAGVAAAAYTLKAPVMQAMAYDERVGLLANTAFAERDISGRKIGEAGIRDAVAKAVETGLSKDDAMSALEKMIADNQVGGVRGALELLPFIGKVKTGSGSSATDVAAMMGSFIGSGYAKDAKGAQRLMSISTAAATAGAFEKGDMAKHLPALLPLAKSAGLTGDTGFTKLLTLLQQARTTAGTSDEAANNVRNLLSKLQSNDTAMDFKKAGRGDLSKHLMQQRAQGVDPLTAWQNVIESEISKNPNIRPAVAKLKNAKNKEEQDAAIESITQMAGGQSMGKFFQDMQAKSALFGLMNKGVEESVNGAIQNLAGSILDTDYTSIASRSGVRARIADEKIELAKTEVIDKFTPAISKVADAFGNLASKYPLLVGGTTLATTALGALAGAAGLASLALGAKIPGAGSIARRNNADPARTGAKARFAGKAGMAAVAGMGAGLLLNQTADENSALSRYSGAAITGASLGSMAGPWGAAIGLAGGLLVQGVRDLMEQQKNFTRNEPEAPRMKGEIELTIKDGKAQVSGSKMNVTGMDMVMNTGNLWEMM